MDPQREVLEVYVLDDGGRYHLAFMDREGKYRSRVLDGFWVRAEWFWQEPLPPVLDVPISWCARCGGEFTKSGFCGILDIVKVQSSRAKMLLL